MSIEPAPIQNNQVNNLNKPTQVWTLWYQSIFRTLKSFDQRIDDLTGGNFQPLAPSIASVGVDGDWTAEIDLASTNIYTWSSDTGATDPTSGYVKVNNASILSATALYISSTNLHSNNLGTIFSDVKAGDRVEFRVHGSASSYFIASINGSVTSGGSYYTMPISVEVASGGFSAEDALEFTLISQSAREAVQVSYDNASSGLTATDVQAAIDELDTAIENIDLPANGYAESSGDTSTNSTTYISKLTLTMPTVDLGTYEVEVSYSLESDKTNMSASVLFEEDSVQLGGVHTWEAKDTSDRFPFSRKFIRTLSGTEVFELSFKSENTNTTITIGEAVITYRSIG